jgi:hypothetical protein
MSAFVERLVAIATHEIGVTELPINSNCGPRVNQYKAATNLPPKEAWPWCAAFVCWVVKECMRRGLLKGESYTFERPTTAGAWALETWSKEQDKSTHTKRPVAMDIKAGDIVIFKFSHVGFAVGMPNVNGDFFTVEGNTDAKGSREGGGVWRKSRNLSQVKTRIRFTI